MLAFLAGTGLSAGIELVQALVPSIGRSCDTTDWTSHAIGVAIGVVLGWIALRLARTTALNRRNPQLTSYVPLASRFRGAPN